MSDSSKQQEINMTTATDNMNACVSEALATTLPRIVVVLNETTDTGRLLNVASHLALGFGASADNSTRAALLLQDYKDASGASHAGISALSLIVLKANGNQIRTLKARAAEAGVPTLDFLETMTGGTYLEQLERTRKSSADNLDYLGILLFGSRDRLDPLTRNFSLFRGR
jgi:hypothetical protein